MRFPRAVNIYGRKYKIVLSDVGPTENDDPSDDDATLAYTDVLRGKIVLYPQLLDQEREFVVQTFIHEVIHAILGESGVDCVLNEINPQFEEVVVSSIAAGLTPLVPIFHRLTHDGSAQ